MRSAYFLLIVGCSSSSASAPDTGPSDAADDRAQPSDASAPDEGAPDEGAPEADVEAPTPPPPAAAVGYTLQTFGPNPTLGVNWQLFTFYGYQGDGQQNSDGSLLIPGTANGVSTAKIDRSNPGGWSGTAFGGGAYFEATFAFTGASDASLSRWPAFWANDIETMSQNAVTAANHWPGQASNYGDWIEVDIMEYDAMNTQKYGIAMHNWYAIIGQRTSTSTSQAFQSIGSADFASQNRYGFLWVPATATTQGYGKYYFNDVQVGATVTWDKYDPTLAPPPVAGSSAYGILDTRHLAMIFDTGTQNPLTITACSVWQKSAADNVTQ